MADILNIVSLVFGQVEPDKFPAAVNAALYREVSDFSWDLERLEYEDGLVCRD
jgi:hypothetical protein